MAVLAAAVAHAHERGILHRDLKPGNILLQRPDVLHRRTASRAIDLGDYVPRICDFGLAKLLDQVSHETCSGVPIGSPAYMAPEQAAGRLREHGPATDVYALGVILYELLTGRPPLRGETDLETLRLVSDQDPPAPRDLAARPAARPRDDLPEMSGEAAQGSLRQRVGTGGRPAAVSRRQARPCPAGPAVAARRQVGQTTARARGTGGVTVLAISVVLGLVLWSGAWLQKHERNLTEAVAQVERDVQRIERSAHGAQIELALAESGSDSPCDMGWPRSSSSFTTHSPPATSCWPRGCSRHSARRAIRPSPGICLGLSPPALQARVDPAWRGRPRELGVARPASWRSLLTAGCWHAARLMAAWSCGT